MKIPKGSDANEVLAPAWLPSEHDGRPAKPVIRCRCGELFSIGRHHVHADGRVTASFLHDDPACGFHEFVELEGYDGPEFLPGVRW